MNGLWLIGERKGTRSRGEQSERVKTISQPISSKSWDMIRRSKDFVITLKTCVIRF